MIAMAGMLFSGDKTFISMAIATMIVVAVAMIGSLTVLPAMLSKLGDRVEKGRIPLLGRSGARRRGRIWAKVLTPVLRRPAVSAALLRRVLLALAIPALQPAHRASPEATRCRAAPRRSRRSTASRPRSPAQASPGRDRGARPTRPAGVKTAVAALRRRPPPAGWATARSASTATRRTPSRG